MRCGIPLTTQTSIADLPGPVKHFCEAIEGKSASVKAIQEWTNRNENHDCYVNIGSWNSICTAIIKPESQPSQQSTEQIGGQKK
jgi:hypothetical protein